MVTISPEFEAFLTPDRQDYIIAGGQMEATPNTTPQQLATANDCFIAIQAGYPRI
jgi:hypothetical protein